MSISFAPEGFEPPKTYAVGGLRLEPLGPEHNERDHEAWMTSIDHVRSTRGFAEGGDWPVEMSLDANLEDLEMHARHFEEGSGFTYSVLDGDSVVGCVYIYPSTEPGFDAQMRCWVTEPYAGFDDVLRSGVAEWLDADWPFEAVEIP